MTLQIDMSIPNLEVTYWPDYGSAMAPAPDRMALLAAVSEKLGVTPNASGAYKLAQKLRLGPDGYQKTRRWWLGGPIRYEDAWVLLDALGWIQMQPRPLELAEELVRQLESGQPVSQRDRERAAKAVERVALRLPGLVAFLREGHQAERRSH